MAPLSQSRTAALCNYECFIHKPAASFIHCGDSPPSSPPPLTPPLLLLSLLGEDYLQDSWVELYLQDINGHFWLLCKRAAYKMFWDESLVEQRLIPDDKTECLPSFLAISRNFLEFKVQFMIVCLPDLPLWNVDFFFIFMFALTVVFSLFLQILTLEAH